MLHVILAMLCTVVIISVLNYKMSIKRAAYWGLIPVAILNIVLRFFMTEFLPERFFYTSWKLPAAVTFVFVFPLLFFSTAFIQYIKDKTNTENINGMICMSILCFAFTLVAAIVIVCYYLRFLGYLP